MARPNRLPPIHALAAFESAARLGGFAQAASELCITASAVSHRVRLLEQLWGVQLFERSPTGVRLSPAAQGYLKGVREAFELLSALGGDAAPERLRVSAPPTFARNMLIPRLPDFYRFCPDVDVDVFVVAPMQEKPARHDLDIRFGQPPFDDRQAIKLFDDVLIALASPRLLAQRGWRYAQDLADTELLRSPMLPWRPWFAAAGLDRPEPQRGAAFTDLGLLLEAAASDLGVALCTRRVAVRWVEAGQLQQIFEVTAPTPQTYYLLMGADQASRAGAAAFADWLREALA